MNQEQVIEVIYNIQEKLAQDFEVNKKECSFLNEPNQITLKVHDTRVFKKYDDEVQREFLYLENLIRMADSGTEDSRKKQLAITLQIIKENALFKLMKKHIKGDVQINIEPFGDTGKSKVVVKSKTMTLEAVMYLVSIE